MGDYLVDILDGAIGNGAKQVAGTVSASGYVEDKQTVGIADQLSSGRGRQTRRVRLARPRS